MSKPKPTIEERHAALAESLQLLTKDVHELQGSVASLERISKDFLEIVKSHEARIHRLEGPS